MMPPFRSPAAPPKLCAAHSETLLHLERSRDFLARSLAAPLTLDDAAREARLSRFHFHRLFSATFRETPHEYVTRLRIAEAKRLLVESDLSVTEVCLAVGYASLGTFSTRFQQWTGYSPSAYRRRARGYFPGVAFGPARFVPTCFLLQMCGLSPNQR